MLHRKRIALSALTLSTMLLSQAAGAVGVRLDSGDWDTLFNGNSSTTANFSTNLNFDASALGITGGSVNVNSAGSLRLLDNSTAEFADFNPFADLAQIGDGRTTAFSVEETNAAFSATGIDAGFRATWSAFDDLGALTNEFQVSLFALSNGQTAIEFNYNQLLAGTAGTQIGYSSSLGTSLDLLSELSVPLGDALGLGDFDPTFPDECPGTPSALACNNYYDGVFGPAASVLPGFAGGYFQSLSGTDATPVQGRYLWLFGDAVDVAEPSMPALLAIGLLGLVIGRRKRAR